QAVGRPEAHMGRVRIAEHAGAAVGADIFRIVADQAVALAGDAVLHLARGGELEALLHTALGLQFGHFGLLWKSVWYRPGSPCSQPIQSEGARLGGFARKSKHCDLCRPIGARRSEARPVDLLNMQRLKVGAGNAAQVYCRHLRPIGAGADGKTLAAALRAELVVDIMLVKPVRLELVGPACQAELVDRHEAQQKALAPAVRTVAAHCCPGNFALDSIGYRAAVAASVIGHGRSSRSVVA